MMGSRQDGGDGPKGSGSVHGYPQIDGHDDQLIRALSLDGRKLFIFKLSYMRMEPCMLFASYALLCIIFKSYILLLYFTRHIYTFNSQTT